MKLKTTPLILGLTVLTVMLSGCLKTRAQLREDGDDNTTQASAPTPVQNSQAGSRYAIDEIKSELTRLTGKIEDVERNQKQNNNDGNKEDIKKLENRIAELEQAQANILEAVKKLQDQPVLIDTKELFDKGKDQFEAGKFEDAVETFTQYLKNSKAKKTEEATYLRGEAYYNLKQYKKAIVDLSKFPEKYTKSKRMPAALYKIALAFEAMNMKEDAKGFYQELYDKYPKSPEGKKAKSKLK